MADLTFEQLVAPPSEDETRERIIGRLNRADFPVTDFHVGAVARTMVEGFVAGLVELAKLRVRIAAGGLSQEASSAWLTLLAHENFGIDRTGATYTTQAVRLYAEPGVGPNTVDAGDLIMEAASGNRYVLNEGVTIPIGTALGYGGVEGTDYVTAEFKAESPGSKYADPTGSLTKFITPLPGVLGINTAPTFTTVEHSGSSTGTLTVTGSPAGPARFSLRILTEGDAGVATFEYSVDGSPYSNGGYCSPTGIVLPGGAVATFSSGSTPSFRSGDVFSFGTPGSPVVTQGRDEETDDALRARMSARVSTELSENALDDTYMRWAFEASPEVTKVNVQPLNSASTPGRVQVLIAGAGPLTTAVVAVQAYIDARHPITDDPVVVPASALEMAASGEVHVFAADLVRIKAEGQLLWQTYLNALPLGGIIRASKLSQILMDLGAIDTVDIRVGPPTLATYAAYPLGFYESATPDAIATLPVVLNWVVH